MLNKCLAPVVAVRVDPAAVVPEVVADVGRAVHLRVAPMAAPMVDLADRLVLPIALHLHLHQLTVETNNKRVGEHELLLQSN